MTPIKPLWYPTFLNYTWMEKAIDALAEEHIPSPRGSERWSKLAIETVLTNAKYTGNVEVLK